MVVAVRFTLQELERYYVIRNTFHAVSSEEIGFGVGLDFVDQVLENLVRVQEDIVGIAVGDLLVEHCVKLIQAEIVEPDLGRLLQPHRKAEGQPTVILGDVGDNILDGPLALPPQIRTVGDGGFERLRHPTRCERCGSPGEVLTWMWGLS